MRWSPKAVLALTVVASFVGMPAASRTGWSPEVDPNAPFVTRERLIIKPACVPIGAEPSIPEGSDQDMARMAALALQAYYRSLNALPKTDCISPRALKREDE